MFRVILFLHIVGSLALGFYLVLPFVVFGLSRLSATAREGAVTIIGSLNRFAQYGLILQLLTGIYLVAKGDYSVAWTAIVGVLLLIAGAMSGMLGKPLRLAKQEGANADVYRKIRSFSSILALSVLVLGFFMVYKRLI